MERSSKNSASEGNSMTKGGGKKQFTPAQVNWGGEAKSPTTLTCRAVAGTLPSHTMGTIPTETKLRGAIPVQSIWKKKIYPLWGGTAGKTVKGTRKAILSTAQNG